MSDELAAWLLFMSMCGCGHFWTVTVGHYKDPTGQEIHAALYLS